MERTTIKIIILVLCIPILYQLWNLLEIRNNISASFTADEMLKRLIFIMIFQSVYGILLIKYFLSKLNEDDTKEKLKFFIYHKEFGKLNQGWARIFNIIDFMILFITIIGYGLGFIIAEVSDQGGLNNAYGYGGDFPLVVLPFFIIIFYYLLVRIIISIHWAIQWIKEGFKTH